MTSREHAGEEFISGELGEAGRAQKAASQLGGALLAAAAATPWGQAFVRLRTQQMLAQRLRTETNATRTSLGQRSLHVPALHDADPWRRIEDGLTRVADDLATRMVDEWRVEQTRYETGERDTLPPWPTVEETE